VPTSYSYSGAHKYSGHLSPRSQQQATVAVDVNGDGIPDVIVSGVDRDGDGVPDAIQQGFPTSTVEAKCGFGPDSSIIARDYKGHLSPRSLSRQATVAVDIDGDGIADVLVTGIDRDGDGIPDALQKSVSPVTRKKAPKRATVLLDIDGDGIADVAVTGVDRDGDGIPDVLQGGMRRTASGLSTWAWEDRQQHSVKEMVKPCTEMPRPTIMKDQAFAKMCQERCEEENWGGFTINRGENWVSFYSQSAQTLKAEVVDNQYYQQPKSMDTVLYLREKTAGGHYIPAVDKPLAKSPRSDIEQALQLGEECMKSLEDKDFVREMKRNSPQLGPVIPTDMDGIFSPRSAQYLSGEMSVEALLGVGSPSKPPPAPPPEKTKLAEMLKPSATTTLPAHARLQARAAAPSVEL